ncbi:hypothetical protein SeLEV6574_g07257 [Synchytrium endobioticum]|uniref:Secreted protein n=1 Tax=Synchytrium endobioticum TaxID=286115 RepID=A0A507CLC8_9FUNG|nr:hypothetical protein SeLEV6574_g07257 [Synchytrium endobioticum]
MPILNDTKWILVSYRRALLLAYFLASYCPEFDLPPTPSQCDFGVRAKDAYAFSLFRKSFRPTGHTTCRCVQYLSSFSYGRGGGSNPARSVDASAQELSPHTDWQTVALYCPSTNLLVLCSA